MQMMQLDWQLVSTWAYLHALQIPVTVSNPVVPDFAVEAV
jgi:hypothetical protein